MNSKIFRYMVAALLLALLAACGQTPAPNGDGVVNSVVVTPETPTVEVGSTVQLTAAVDADAGVDTDVTWSSSATGTATVNDTGLVTGVAEGTALITATSVADPDVSDTVTVTVATQVDPAVNSVTIDGDPQRDVIVNQTLNLSATVDAVGGADDTVTWTSSNESIATVDATTGVVTGVTVGGPVDITATSTFNASVSDSVAVTVVEAPQVLYVDDDAAAGGDGSQASPFNTIGEALAVLTAGGFIEVAAGTYTEDVSVGTSVTLNGANADTATGRAAESTLSGTVTIDGAGIDVTFNGFQFQSATNPGVVSTGVDHSVTYVFNAFNGNFTRVRATEPANFRFENNTANITAQATAGFVNVSGDYDGSAGTSVTIANNAMTFNRGTNTAPAANLSTVSGTFTGNDIDMTAVIGGRDNSNIGLLLAGTSGDLTIDGNTIVNANQAVRFFSIGTIDNVAINANILTANRQGIVMDSGGTVSNVAVTGNTITGGDESIRAAQTGMSVSNNTFETAANAYFVDASSSYDLNAILTTNGNTFNPAGTVGTFDSVPAIVP